MRQSASQAALRAAAGSKFDTSAARTVLLIDCCRLSVDNDASIDDRIGAIAARQRGRVWRKQLLAAGITPSAIARRLRRGRLESIHLGVYGLPGTAELPLAAETAALLAAGDDAVLSHHSAATLHRLRPGVARPVHITIPTGRAGPTLKGVVVHRSRTLMPTDVRHHQGLPVTAPARTLLDVAATLPDRDLERLLDEALFVRRIASRAQLFAVVKRAGRHPGRGRLTRLLRDHTRTSQTESPPEEQLLTLIRAAGLPEPRLRVPMLDYRLDMFWPELKLAVEVDAYGTHGSAARFEADRRRDGRLLTEKRIAVLRLTKLRIEQRPFEAVALIASEIAHRQAERRAA